ncbi:cytochrome c [Microbulbifer halophilus]|nr:cytochrome c [Microbulbifer halophilus]MCW8127693.1 cytochrome c [Microbulbifer halophilus]
MIKWLLAATIALAAGLAAFIYSGLYPIGADAPHAAATNWALATLRDRSIARASRDTPVPDLEDPELLLSGGPDYNDMCAGCHLKPGRDESDLSIGLYPTPPNLSKRAGDPRHQFWVIKHGIKTSGMPAWGPTHDDERIWAMVAFLQKLPELTPQQYQVLTARDSESGDHH